MFELVLSLYVVLSFCLVALVAPFAVFLYRRTGLCAALWLALFLALHLALDLLQPTLSIEWSSVLLQGGPYQRELPWGIGSPAHLQIILRYLTAIPLHLATLLVCALCLGDVLSLLQRQGVRVDTRISGVLLALSRRHVACGASMLLLLLLCPLAHIAIAHYIVENASTAELSLLVTDELVDIFTGVLSTAKST
jgi:hypothetical protein